MGAGMKQWFTALDIQDKHYDVLLRHVDTVAIQQHWKILHEHTHPSKYHVGMTSLYFMCEIEGDSPPAPLDWGVFK